MLLDSLKMFSQHRKKHVTCFQRGQVAKVWGRKKSTSSVLLIELPFHGRFSTALGLSAIARYDNQALFTDFWDPDIVCRVFWEQVL